MAPLSLKIVIDDGAVTRTVKFETTTKVHEAHLIVQNKILTLEPDKEYGFFLKSADDDCSGVWLEPDRSLDYYMLRDGDYLQYMPKLRNLRLRMLDDTVKTLQVDETKKIGDLMFYICDKIGIANHEEYGFCDIEEPAVVETKPSTGTLTLKRTAQREKDAELQQLIKKLKTDNNVEWLDQHKTLRELRVDPKKTLLLKRRLFYSDRNVDSRDPLQLNLLYVQTRDAILDGAHVVTEEKAVEFAGLQCQIQYSDFHEDKHRSGFIENLKEFLPAVYASSRSAEKKVFREHRKHCGLSAVEAKHLYIKMARELPTFGVTFFVVKEQLKGKKKLVPRLLGINSSSILRLDQETKEILQTWLLTQVKTYKASNETFTLNFGDYSDKEYAVKTNEGFRIKDILEGYIDIIRKRLVGREHLHAEEGDVIMEQNISASKGNTIINHTSRRVETHSLVGPSQIITMEQGHNMKQGTNVTTVHQIQMSRSANQGEHGVAAMQGYNTVLQELSRDKMLFSKKLNYLNSDAVQAVHLLLEPTPENIQRLRDIAQGMRDSLPDIVKGVKETAAKLDEAESKKLLDELDELCRSVNTLFSIANGCDLDDPDKLMMAENAAKKIADLSAQINFSLDPKSKRRSLLLLRSHKSFIADEKTSSSIRRASFLTAAGSASQAVETAQEDLQEVYHGPVPDEEEISRLEDDAVDKMGKLNAAVALLLIAHADPNNVDYEMAVKSMTAIHDCIPQLMKDAKALGVAKGEPYKTDLLDRVKELCDRTKNICMLTGTDDTSKMQEAGNKFADVSKKLLFTFGQGRHLNPKLANKDKEIKDLVMAVGNKASQLLMKVNELDQVADEDPACEQVDRNAVKCADAVQALLACARLTAHSIQEPHCQSALSAAIENLASSSMNLSASWKPVVEKPGNNVIGIQLTERSLKLAKALDNLKSSYSNLNGDIQEEIPEPQLSTKQKKRLKFISSLSSVKEEIEDATKDLENIKPKVPGMAPKINDKETKRRLAGKLAQLNAAIASLLQATADPDNHNIRRAQRAVDNIRILTPSIVDEAKLLNGNVDSKTWNTINADLRSAFEAVNGMCDNATENNGEALKENISQYARASTKLTHICNPQPKVENNRGVLDLARLACEQTSVLLSKVYQLAESVGEEQGQALDQTGAKTVDAGKALLSTAEVTAPSMNDPRCQASIITAVDNHATLAKELEKLWNEVLPSIPFSPLNDGLRKDTESLHDILKEIRSLCQMGIGYVQDHPSKLQYLIGDEKQRLQFATSLSSAKDTLHSASGDLKNTKIEKRVGGPKIDVKETRQQLGDALAVLNAAIASLMQATADREKVNMDQADSAIKTIHQLTPGIVNTVKTLNGNIEDDEFKEISGELKTMLDTAKSICDDPNENKYENINDLLSRYANSSGKLISVLSPEISKEKEKQVLELSRKACVQTSELLSKVYQLVEDVGGEEGTVLELAGSRVVDAAQTLLTTAQITAPSLNDTRCRVAVASATSNHIEAAKELDKKWKEIVKNPDYAEYAVNLNNNSRKLQDTLDRLRDRFQTDTGKPLNNPPEKKRLKFITSLSNAKNAIADASKDLEDRNREDPDSATKINVRQTQRGLADKLAQLNAAIASLMQATADRQNPDTHLAESVTETIRTVAPEIVKAVKSLNGNMDEAACKAINEDLKCLLEAAKDICDNTTNDNMDIQDVVSKFAHSSGKLMFTFNPRVKTKKEKQVMDLSRSACVKTSEMLSKVYELAESVGGEQGQALDEVGAEVVDAAQTLLKSAEVTSPSINDPRCQASLVTAVERQSKSVNELEKVLHPVVQNPQYLHYKNDLQKDSQGVQDTLDKLRDLCQTDGADEDNLSKLLQSIGDEKQRLHFITTLSSAKNAIGDAKTDLNNIKSQGPGNAPGINGQEQPRRLADRLAQLNAAIASLMTASADSANPDAALAQHAIETISKVIPDILNDAKTLNVDDRTWQAIFEDLRSMFEATEDLCGNTNGNNIKDKNDALSKFAAASGNLAHVLDATANNKEKQVLDLSRAACEQTSAMLSTVYELAENVGGEEGLVVDLAGAKVVDAAQRLFTTAEVTGPYINDARCQASLMSAVDNQCSLVKELDNTLAPIVNKTEYRQYKDNLQKSSGALQELLGKIKELCQNSGKLPEKQHLKFITSLSNAKKAIVDASKDLEDRNRLDPDSVAKINVRQTQRGLADKLAQLNAAVASIMQAIADHENPDTKLAESAIDTILAVTPDIVKAVKSLDGNMDESARKAIEEDLKCLLEATKDICDSPNDKVDVQDAVSKFANTSGKLMFTFNPRVKTKKEKQVLDLSRLACQQTSTMLSKVYELAESVGGEQGYALDKTGSNVIEAAQALLVTAKVIASSIDDNRSIASIVSAADKESISIRELEKVLGPVVQNPKYRNYKDHLQKDSKCVQDTLDKLRSLCQINEGTVPDDLSKLQQSFGDEKQRNQFITTLSSAKYAVDGASKDLENIKKQAHGSVPNPNMQETRQRLADRLAELNAAIASLARVTADRENPDLKLAESAIETIRAVAPHIVKDVKTLNGSVDDKSWKVITEDLKLMLEATGDLCGNSDTIIPKDINDTLFKFAAASGNLAHVLDPTVNLDKKKQVLDLSKSACEQTSAMLATVYELEENVGEEEGKALDLAGAKVVDAAKTLLTTAEVTASSINDARCQASLVSAVDNQCSSTKELENTWTPIVNNTKYHQYKDDLQIGSSAVQDTLGKLRELCQDSDRENPDTKLAESATDTILAVTPDIVKGKLPEKQRHKFITSLSNAKDAIVDASKDLQDGNRHDPDSVAKINVRQTQRGLADKLAQLNAAVASLMQATADRENPDTKLVESATDTIVRVTPDIVKAVKSLNGNMDETARKAIEEDLMYLLEATKDICDTNDKVNMQDVASKFANSSEKLMFTFKPRVQTMKEKQVLDLSRTVCEQTSAMLSKVYELAESVGGEQGYAIDDAGAKVIEAAQVLLVTAEVTTSSIDDPRSIASIVSAADKESISIKQLEKVLEPVVQNPKYRNYKDDLQKDSQSIQYTLDKLRGLCQINEGTVSNDLSKLQQSIGDEKQRVQFITTLSSAKYAVDGASKDLENIKKQAHGSVPNTNTQETRRRLADRLAQLNVAIASLARATADRENLDLKLAECSIETIRALAPDIVKDTKTLNGSVDDKSWKAITEDLKSMLEATGDLCGNSDQNNTKDINDTLSKFAAASGNLVHVLDPTNNLNKEKQVLELSRSACKHTSAMLSQVYLLAKNVGEEEAHALDLAGAKVGDAAQTLLITAEVTAPSINDARCQASLVSAVDNQCSSTKELENICKPIISKTKYHQYGDGLQTCSGAVHDTLGKIRDLCKDSVSQEERLQLNNGLASSKKVINDAIKALERTKKQEGGTTPVINVRKTQRGLADKLAQLNAAIASLIKATADQKNPDIKLAESAIDTIHKAVPELIDDVKSFNGNVGDTFWSVITNELKSMLEATSSICDNSENKDMSEVVYKLGKSSAKLMNVVSPRPNVKKEKEVLDLSRSACEQTSALLLKVYQLAENVSGEQGQALDQTGAKVVDAAQTLLSTSKITAPLIKDTRCQLALISAVETHSSLAKELESTWKPIVQKNEYHQYGDNLQRGSQLVQTTLDKLRELCKPDPSQQSQDEDLHVSEAKESIMKSQKLLDEKIKSLPSSCKTTTKTIDDPTLAQRRLLLSQKLAKLNESIAQLVQAFKTTDGEHLDHKSAQEAIATLSQLTPEIVQDIISLDQNTGDDCSQMLEEARVLCKASTDICARAEENDVKGLHMAAIEYAGRSNKLRFIFNPPSDPIQINQLLGAAKSVCERTSLMLPRVSQLAEYVEPAAKNQLHSNGTELADAAQTLLTIAQVTSSSISDGGCKSRLISSADDLLASSQNLRKIWQPLAQNELNYSIGEQLNKDHDILRMGVNNLKAACADGTLQKKPTIKEKLIITEDCPLKQMAKKILSTAQAKSKSSSVPQQEQELLIKFCNELDNALKAFDIANAKCRNQPIDAKRRGELESVILNIQQMCLFSKDLSAETSFIVDLANYVTYCTSAAEDVIKATRKIMPKTNHVQEVQNESHKIIQEAASLLGGFETEGAEIIDDILKYDHFAKSWEDRVKNMIEVTHEIPDGKSNIGLQEKLQILKENTDLFRFAAKCNLSTAMGVSVDETLENLTDIEKHIEDIIKSLPGLQSEADVKNTVINAQEALISSLVSSDNIPKAFAEYTLQMRSTDKPDEKYRLKLRDHLKRLAELLKSQVAVKGRMVATWQDVDGAETTAITDKIIHELDSFNQDGNTKPDASLAVSNEYKNLFMTRNLKISGDNRELLDKFKKWVNKLSIDANTIVLSSHQPESLSRCINLISETASQVASTARSIKNENPVVEKQIQDAAQHMCKATYKILKVAQSLERTTNQTDGRRRLQEACRLLNDSINRLVRTVIPGDKQRDSDEMSRYLQMQGAFLRAKLPSNALGYNDCLDALQTQQDVIQKLISNERMTKAERNESLSYITSAIRNAIEYATQSAYLLSLSKDCRNTVMHGLVDTNRLKKMTETLRDDCMTLLYCGDLEQIKHIKSEISKQTDMLQKSIDDHNFKLEESVKNTLEADMHSLKSTVQSLHDTVHGTNGKDNMVSRINGICKVVDAINNVNNTIDKIVEPEHSPQPQGSSQEIIDNTRELVTSMSSLSKKAASNDEDCMTWVVFGGVDVVKKFEMLVNCIRQKGKDADIIASSKKQEEEVPVKSYIEIQVDLAKKWLQYPASKPEARDAGIKGIQYAIEMADKITEDLQEAEKEDMKHVVTETKRLLAECTQKYNSDKASLLLERLKELKKMLERGVVTRVVEDFLQEDPIIDVEALASKEQDKNKRKFILDRKIAELQAQLGKVTQTVRFVADTGSGKSRRDLIDTSNKIELLAPSLVKAAQQRLESPENKEAIEEYMQLVEQYAKTIASMRNLCDKAVDPIDFAQAAGETMQRIKEEKGTDGPQNCQYTSKMILRLGNRVVEAGMNSPQVMDDPEMKNTLMNIKKTIDCNQPEQQADWRAIFAEILQKTSQVESVLGGENIFNHQPEANQPIFAAAHDLHAAVREWSARDNDIVAGAKRMAVLMAKLARSMETDNKRQLIFTSKEIVKGAEEVAALARKLALECSDMRIRTNLLQVCDKIPTIGGQLKILTTVKGSSLGHQGSTEDKEAMNMLVCNAQNLMTSIQEVVKAAASASVKIMSQRGSRMKWVRRKNYY